MNLIIGNTAGTFSTILNYLSWMVIKDISENEISLDFHWTNKTDFSGNTFYGYKNVKKQNFYEPLIHRPNIMSHLFEYAPNSFMEDYEEYVESYPHNSQYLIKNCPELLIKYNGGGSIVNQYYDLEYLSNIRNIFNSYWKKFKLSNHLMKKLEQESKILKNKKVLTVMIRCSEHYSEPKILLENFINQVNCKIDNYDCILLLTQVQEIFDIFVETFGDFCIFPKRERIPGDIDWKGGRGIIMSNEEYIKEVEECLIDVFLASKTSHILSGASNMFLGALTINPEITFDVFEFLKSNNGR